MAAHQRVQCAVEENNRPKATLLDTLPSAQGLGLDLPDGPIHRGGLVTCLMHEINQLHNVMAVPGCLPGLPLNDLNDMSCRAGYLNP